jgi:hypothetical protein
MNNYIVVREEKPETFGDKDPVVGPITGVCPTEEHATDTAKSMAFSDAENDKLFNYAVYKRIHLVTAAVSIEIKKDNV